MIYILLMGISSEAHLKRVEVPPEALRRASNVPQHFDAFPAF
jgi:hypothetical protein